MSVHAGLRRMTLVAVAAVMGVLTVSAPAQAATYVGYLQGTCLQAVGSAYRLQLKIPVSEVNVPLVNGSGAITGRINATTAYMTMNVEWCSNGSNVTYATIASSNADRTGGGAASNLERKSYRSSFTKPTAVGGPYTLGTSASWGRNGTVTVSGQPFGVGGQVQFALANFTSTMTVKIYPSEARVECTGTSGGNAEFCSLNY